MPQTAPITTMGRTRKRRAKEATRSTGSDMTEGGLVVVLVSHVGEAELPRDVAPLLLEVGALVVRQADSARVEVDVQHLPRPRRRHHFALRRRLPARKEVPPPRHAELRIED